jgi:hypothetical protein
VSVVVLFLTAIVTLVLGGQWYFVVLTAVWAAIGLAILMYLCALLALGCIRPKVVLDPSILGIRMAAFFKFTKGTFLVLLGAGLGLYVSATGEYFADDARWAKIGLKDEPWVNMPTPVRASMFGIITLANLVPGIGVFALLYFGLLTSWDLWRASYAGRLRAAGTVRLLMRLFVPKVLKHPVGRMVPRWFLELIQPSSVAYAAVVVAAVAFFLFV